MPLTIPAESATTHNKVMSSYKDNCVKTYKENEPCVGYSTGARLVQSKSGKMTLTPIASVSEALKHILRLQENYFNHGFFNEVEASTAIAFLTEAIMISDMDSVKESTKKKVPTKAKKKS
jgi:hypothetical protein